MSDDCPGPCYPRRCCSCIAFRKCEPCDTEMCCSHCCCCWTMCPCCCRRTCRSCSICGFQSKKQSCEHDMRLKHVTGHYLKIKSNDISDLHKRSSSIQNSQANRHSRSNLIWDQWERSCKSGDHLQNLPNTSGCTEKLMSECNACEQPDVCRSYEDFNAVPFTYYPEQIYMQQYQRLWARKVDYSEHFEELKRRLLSLKDRRSCPKRILFNKNILNDLNKLYATVGGGSTANVGGRDGAKDTDSVVGAGSAVVDCNRNNSKPSTYQSIPAQTPIRYRKLPGKRRSPLRSSNFTKPSLKRRPLRKQRNSPTIVPEANSEQRVSMPTEIITNDSSEARGSSNIRGPSDSIKSSYVYSYPTQLRPSERARLSPKEEDRLTLFGSRVAGQTRSSGQINLQSYGRRHTIRLSSDA